MPLRDLGLGGFLLLGIAGALGTWTRYLVGAGASRLLGSQFPVGTLAVNALGCFARGFFAHGSAMGLSPALRLVVMTGFLGGLTTYSAFNNDTVVLLESRGATPALSNVLATLLLCLATGTAGAALARRLLG
jgi:CrcB protein